MGKSGSKIAKFCICHLSMALKFERRDSILEQQAEEERHLESEEGKSASEGREAEIEAGIAQLQRV